MGYHFQVQFSSLMVNFHQIKAPTEGLPSILHLGVGHLPYGPSNQWRFSDRWSLHAYTYHGKLIVDGQSFNIIPGSCSLIPPGVHMQYLLKEGQGGRHHFCLFKSNATGTETCPVIQDLGSHFSDVDGDLVRAIAEHHQSPKRAESTLLQIIWKLTDHGRPSPSQGRIGQATQIIDAGLAGPISVPKLAAACGCSHNTLTREFKKVHGYSVVHFINQRRCERAKLYLEQGFRPTEVVNLVGVGDLQRFNKLMRQHLGQTPRQIIQT